MEESILIAQYQVRRAQIRELQNNINGKQDCQLDTRNWTFTLIDRLKEWGSEKIISQKCRTWKTKWRKERTYLWKVAIRTKNSNFDILNWSTIPLTLAKISWNRWFACKSISVIRC